MDTAAKIRDTKQVDRCKKKQVWVQNYNQYIFFGRRDAMLSITYLYFAHHTAIKLDFRAIRRLATK